MININDHLRSQILTLSMNFRIGFEGTNKSAEAHVRARYNEVVSAIRPLYGLRPTASQPLLTKGDDNAKYDKATSYQVGLSLNPDRIKVNGRWYTMCPDAGDCVGGCVSMAGNGRFDQTVQGRKWKTHLLISHPHLFVWKLGRELRRIHDLHGASVAARLNTFSDVAWESICPTIFEMLSDWQFLDYTKSYDRAVRSVAGFGPWPRNYSLAYSWNEKSDIHLARQLLAWDGKVSVVVADTVTYGDLRDTFGYDINIVDADKSDEWMLERHGGTVGYLKPKGHKIKPLIKRGSRFIATPANLQAIQTPVTLRAR